MIPSAYIFLKIKSVSHLLTDKFNFVLLVFEFKVMIYLKNIAQYLSRQVKYNN